jgi:hypothetical protein
LTEPDPLLPLSSSQQQLLAEAVKRYEDATETEPDVWAWLAARGLDHDSLAVRTHRLGVVADPMPGHEKYRGWLCIPYLSAADDRHPVQVRFRCLQDHNCREKGHGKYASLSGDRGRMYNVQALQFADDVIHLCEGELDAITLVSCGLPAVAVPGAQAWRPHYRRVLAGFSKVHVWADPDEAGSELLSRVMKALPQAQPVRLTDGDVNETFRRYGSEHLKDLVRGTTS